MIGLAVLFGLLSMLGYGLSNVFSQPLARQIGSAPLLFLRGFTIVILLALASIPDYGKLSLHAGSAGMAFGLGVAGYIPVLAFTHGVKVSRVSIVAPIAGTSTLVSVLLTFWLLHTPITTLQWAAIALVTVANIVVAVNIRDLRQSDVLQLSSGIPFALVAALGWGLFFYLLIYPTRALGPWLSALFVESGVTVAAGLHIALSRQTVRLKDALRSSVSINGLTICLGTIAYTVGVRSYNVAIVVALANSPAIVSTFVGMRLFHERLRRLELAAGAAMILGVIIISVG